MVANTFFSGKNAWDITFYSKLKTFISENKYGYYMDVYIPESKVTSLMKLGISSEYDNGFHIRCRLYSSSIILCNGRRLSYLHKGLTTQSLVTPENTIIKSLELNPYAQKSKGSKASNDTQCSVIRVVFKTESLKLPKEF